MNKNYGKRLAAVFISMILLIGCTACSMSKKSAPPDRNGNQVTPSEEKVTLQPQEQESLFDAANLTGSVVEFSDDQLILSSASVTKDKSGGEVMEEAAPGSEDQADLITIWYSKKTNFEIVTLDSESLMEVSRSKTEKSSIKKQSSILIFGSCQDTHHWTADTVTIIRWKK